MRVALLTIVALLAVTPAAGAATKRPRCPSASGFSCGTLTVPLDRATPGGPRLRLRYAVQRGTRPVLVALTGGPGQPGVVFGSSFAGSLRPALRKYRLAVIDQRGTGASGVLSCPSVQRLGALDLVPASALAACAARIGPRRAHYATRDTVEDLEALRVRLGQPELALMGVSYGTFVAQQYARVHPATTSALILDSVVGADGVDAFLLDSFRVTARVLRSQCASRRCRGVTRDPVADLAEVVAQVNARGIAGPTFDARGARRTSRYSRPDELANLLIAGDLNPYLQASLPGAIAAASRGDSSLLLRLRRIGMGGTTSPSELSFGLNVATVCADSLLPYSLLTPFAQRDAAIAAAVAALDPQEIAPFDAATVQRMSTADDCSRWPQDVVTPPSTDPLPDVPTLLLSGSLDLRTPLENAEEVAAELPRASLVRVPGVGHDELDTAPSDCVRQALDRFVRGRKVGSPCSGTYGAVRVFPRPPRSLKDFSRAPGVPGDRGRALFAVLDTITDSQLTGLQYLYADLKPQGGGLHGGRFSFGNQTRLTRYAFVPGLRVTGRLDADLAGTVRVEGRGVNGHLRLSASGAAVGRLGGRAVAYRPGRARAASGEAAAPPLTSVFRARVDSRRARVARRRHHVLAGHP